MLSTGKKLLIEEIHTKENSGVPPIEEGDFFGSLNYECLLDKFTIWELLPDCDLGNLEYYTRELKGCTLSEVRRLERRFKNLFEILKAIQEPTGFVQHMQNACWNIINSKK